MRATKPESVLVAVGFIRNVLIIILDALANRDYILCNRRGAFATIAVLGLSALLHQV